MGNNINMCTYIYMVKWPHLTTCSSPNSFFQWKLVFQVPVRLQIATAQGLLQFHPWKDSWHKGGTFLLVPT